LGGDFNGHVGTKADGYDGTRGGFNYGERNSGRVSIPDFVVTHDLVIVNYLFNKEDHLVTFRSGIIKTQIHYFLVRVNDKMSYKDCK